MSLDIHVSGNEAELEYPDFWLDELSHRQLMQAVARAATPMRLTSRIRDYYSDAEFHTSEMDGLAAELGMLEKQVSNEAVLEAIRGLMKVCLKASEEGANLYFFCD